MADELHQDVTDQRLPVFGRQSLLQCVPEEQVSLQQLLYKLQIRLTGSQHTHTHTQQKHTFNEGTEKEEIHMH